VRSAFFGSLHCIKLRESLGLLGKCESRFYLFGRGLLARRGSSAQIRVPLRRHRLLEWDRQVATRASQAAALSARSRPVVPPRREFLPARICAALQKQKFARVTRKKAAGRQAACARAFNREGARRHTYGQTAPSKAISAKSTYKIDDDRRLRGIVRGYGKIGFFRASARDSLRR